MNDYLTIFVWTLEQVEKLDLYLGKWIEARSSVRYLHRHPLQVTKTLSLSSISAPNPFLLIILHLQHSSRNSYINPTIICPRTAHQPSPLDPLSAVRRLRSKKLLSKPMILHRKHMLEKCCRRLIKVGGFAVLEPPENLLCKFFVPTFF